MPRLEDSYAGVPAEAIQFAGAPDGPEKWIPGLGMFVPTFTQPMKHLNKRNFVTTLMHHVPQDKRGKYQIPGDAEKGPNGERLDSNRYAFCIGIAGANDVNEFREHHIKNFRHCNSLALNWSGYCAPHGGGLHPLDKTKVDWTKVPREVRFARGHLDPEELTDEELAKGQVLKDDGTWTRFRNVPQAVHDQLVRKLFERADQKLRENLVEAVQVMAEIAASPAVEPADRINAAKWIFERVRGKVASEVKITQDKPFEVVLGAVLQGGSRAASRAGRGLDGDVGQSAELDNVVDAEFEEQPVSEALYDDDLEGDGRFNARTNPNAASPPIPVVTPPVVPPPSEPPGVKQGPPEDPILRDQYEKKKVHQEAEERARELKEFQERIKRARAKRYAARAQGYDDVVPTPFEIEVEDSPSDGPAATKVFWTAPEEPKLSKAQHEKAQRKSRKKEWE